MTHVWAVLRDGEQIGTVEAVSRKGACHAAYEKFQIDHAKRGTIEVKKVAHTGGIVSGLSPRLFDHGEVICSFNPSLARRYIGIDPAGPGGDSCVEITIENGEITDIRSLP